MGRRGAGRRLNDQERMEILDLMAKEPKTKNVDLAKRYGVSEGAIRKLKQIKDTIRDRYILGNEHNRDKRKRGGFRRNAQFEQELYEWICRMRETQAYQLIPLTQTAVRQQAIILAKNYETMATFKASPGWFARFCSRHRLDPPMAPTRDLDAMAVETEAAAAATATANESLLATTVAMSDTKLPPSHHDVGASGADASMAIAFPQAPVDAMPSLEVNVDDTMSASAVAVEAVTAAATAAVPNALVVANAAAALQVPVESASMPAEPAEPTLAESTEKPMAVDLSCPEAVVENHAAEIKIAPLSSPETSPDDVVMTTVDESAPVAEAAPVTEHVAVAAPVTESVSVLDIVSDTPPVTAAVPPSPVVGPTAATTAAPVLSETPASLQPKVEPDVAVATPAAAPSPAPAPAAVSEVRAAPLPVARSVYTEDEIFSMGL